MNAKLWSVIALLFMLLAGVAVYRAWPLLFPEVVMSATLDPRCNLRAGACSSRLGEGREVRFGIEPRDIPLIRPLTLRVEARGFDVQGVEVDFSGVDMNMGFNRPRLTRQGDGAYTGTATLPVCVRDVMQWEARVLLRTGAGLVSVPYQFLTAGPGAQLPAG
ncbi:MAG: hypothetical protein AB2814_12105 [Candidatus Sedimenticola endophacoides]